MEGEVKGSIDGDALDDKEYIGSIISLLENAETFIKNNLKDKDYVGDYSKGKVEKQFSCPMPFHI